MRHIIMQTTCWVLVRYYVLIHRILKPPVGTNYSPPLEGRCLVKIHWAVVSCPHKLSRVRHIIMQTTCWVLVRYYVLIQRILKPLVGKCTRADTPRPSLHKRIMSCRYNLLCLLCLTMPLTVATETEITTTDNPFQTFEARPQQAKPQQQIDPLTAYPVAQYVVHGVIVTADNAVAVVYSPRKTWHRLRVDAQLGQEQAVIRQITTKGIQIDIQNTLLWLPVLQ